MSKKSVLLLILVLSVFMSLNAAITYSAVTSKSDGRFITYTGTTTVAYADTANVFILSPVFRSGTALSGKGLIIHATVVDSIQHTFSTDAGTAQSAIEAVLQVSPDGINFIDMYRAPAYRLSNPIAGAKVTVPMPTKGAIAPYFRIKWVGYSAAGVINVADIYGTITTTVVLLN